MAQEKFPYPILDPASVAKLPRLKPHEKKAAEQIAANAIKNLGDYSLKQKTKPDLMPSLPAGPDWPAYPARWESVACTSRDGYIRDLPSENYERGTMEDERVCMFAGWIIAKHFGDTFD